MDGFDPKGLDMPFRRHALEWIMTKLNDLTKKSNNLAGNSSLNDLALKFEGKIYEKATNKRDYLYNIQTKISDMLKVCLPAAFPTGNQLGNTVISRPVIQSYPAEQNIDGNFRLEQKHNQPFRMHMPAPSSTMQPRNTAVHTALNQFQQNQQFRQQSQQFGQRNQHFGQQNLQFGHQNRQFGQHNLQFGQQNQQFGQFGYRHQQFGQQNVAQRDIGYSLANLRHGSEMSSAYIQSQNCGGDKLIPQSHMSSTTVASALSSISEAETANADQCQLLTVQFRRARSSYLPELYKWSKMFQAQILQAQTIDEFNGAKKPVVLIQQMIRLLNLPENELILYGWDKLHKNLNAIISYYNQMVKKVTIAMNQSSQSSVLTPAYTNVTQNTQTDPALMNRPVISPLTITPGFSYSHPTAVNSLLHGSVISTEQFGMKSTMLHSVPQGPADHKTLLNMKKDPQMVQSSPTSKLPEKRKDLMDSKSNLSNNDMSKKQCSKLREQLSGISHESWLNLASLRSKGRSIPTKLHQSSSSNNEQKEDKSSLSQPKTPPTPGTPSSVPRENANPVKFAMLELSDINNGDTQVLIEAIQSQGEAKLEDQDPLLGMPEIPASPMVSDCTGPVNTQPHSAKRPIDRLIKAVKSISKKALISGVDDMRTAVTEMDGLPEIAYTNESDTAMEDDLTIFVEDLHHYCMDNEEPPNKKIKRDIESVSRDAPMPWDNHACTQSNLEPNQKLMDEINETNTRLFETLMQEVTTDTSNKINNGTIVRCTYSPIAMSTDTKRMFASESIDLSVEFHVPFDYPISPPKILDCRLPGECVGITIEMRERAKSLFDSQVRGIDPLRVGEMAQVWDHCSRSVLVAYAKLLGAETFNFKNSVIKEQIS